MKKLIVLVFIVFLLAACSDEWYAHDSIYKDWYHIIFSWWGHNNVTSEEADMSEQSGLWGVEIPYIPAELLHVKHACLNV